MTIKRLLRLVRSMYPTEFEDEVLLLWLSQCENTLLTEVMLLSVADCTEYTEANDATLLVPHPYDKLYLPYMQAMICQANGETDKYMNHMQVYNAYRDEYARWVCATISPAYGEAIQNGYYLSAYSISQAHGYSGTVEEWLESLKGPAGEPGKDGKPGLNGVGADPKYSAVLQQLFEDGNAGFPYAEENREGSEPYSYGAAMLLRTEAEKMNYGSITMPSTGKVVELIRDFGSGWVDVTEDFLTQQEPPEEYLRMRPKGRWQIFYGTMLHRAEIVESYDGKNVLLTSYSDDPYFYAEMYAGDERVFRIDSEIGEAELSGKKVWTGEGGRTYVGAEEPVGAPDGSLWVVHSTDSKPKGISLYYTGENEEALKNAPNGSVWLAPKSSNKPATPEGGITEETDPTVPAWAKQPQKPTYTAAEVGAATQEDIEKALANLPTGDGKKPWRKLDTIDFSLEKNQIAEFGWTDLGGVTDIFMKINGVQNGSATESGYNLHINGKDIAQGFAPSQKSGTVWYWWAAANYDGLVWNPIRTIGTVNGDWAAMGKSALQIPYNKFLDVGAAKEISLHVLSAAYKNIAGTWEIWVR